MRFLRDLPFVKDGKEYDPKYKLFLQKELGRGESGITYLCESRQTGKQFACKCINKRPHSDSEIKSLRHNEVAVLRHLSKHRNVIALEDVFEDEGSIRIVTELCDGGDLFCRLPKKGYYSEQGAAVILGNVMGSIQLCHSHGVIHRDVKPENFLFLNKSKSSPIKMIDFGLSTFHAPHQKHNAVVGSPSYAAPEILHGGYGPKVDVWSAGVILHYMLCGSMPFTAQAFWDGNHQLFLGSGSWEKVSTEAKSLLKAMLHPDAGRRPSALEVINHPWLMKKVDAHNNSINNKMATLLHKLKTSVAKTKRRWSVCVS